MCVKTILLIVSVKTRPNEPAFVKLNEKQDLFAVYLTDLKLPLSNVQPNYRIFGKWTHISAQVFSLVVLLHFIIRSKIHICVYKLYPVITIDETMLAFSRLFS